MAAISINTDIVGSAVNRIDTLCQDIQTRVTKFADLVAEKNQQTDNKWKLLAKLQDKVNEEVGNVKAINESLEETKTNLNRYIEAVAEADDDSVLN